MEFVLHIPSARYNEACWAADVIFRQFLGMEVCCVKSNTCEYRLEHAERILYISNAFFEKANDTWLMDESLPDVSKITWDDSVKLFTGDVVDKSVPILFGKHGFYIDDNGNGHLGLDIIGTAFFMLSRYEELIIKDKDDHHRFPAKASLSYKLRILSRPIVDEYVEVLWHAMRRVWSDIQRKERIGSVVVTCDVDEPYDCASRSFLGTLKRTAGDIVKRKSVVSAVSRVKHSLDISRKDYRMDPQYTFSWYMDACEKEGRKATFYFIAGHTSKKMDGCYQLEEPRILQLLKQIHLRGHKLGVHTSYNSYHSEKEIINEKDNMQKAYSLAGIDSDVEGNRQHYLRWDASITADLLNNAGFLYDTTGSYADIPGFRYGTSHPFNMWGWKDNAPLKLQQRPLVLMEGTVISERYMGMGYSESTIELMSKYKKSAMKYGGDFVMLWHNNHFNNDQDKEYFLELLK